MRTGNRADRRCCYIVPIERKAVASESDPASDLAGLCAYLSSLAVAGCDVVVLDASEPAMAEENHRYLRWVARHEVVAPNHDVMLSAAEAATCEAVIVAAEDVRYSAADIVHACALLEAHEVVEPHEYVHPLPWWGSVDAARALMQRALQADAGHAATFAFRRSAVRPMRRDPAALVHPVRRFHDAGAEVFSASDFFVRRTPPRFTEWLRGRAAAAESDLAVPVRSIFFFALLPVALMLLMFVGVRPLAGFAGSIGLASVVLAMRGRRGAGALFPLRTCMLAPLWIAERSLTIYGALFRRLRMVSLETSGNVPATPNDKRVAGGAR